jgi:hypothetical protein
MLSMSTSYLNPWVSFHYACKVIANGQGDIGYVEATKKMADILNKPLVSRFRFIVSPSDWQVAHEDAGKGNC